MTSFIILELSSRTTFVELQLLNQRRLEEASTSKIWSQIILSGTVFICYQLSFVDRWSRNHENTKWCPFCSVRGQFSILVTYFCRWFEKMENYSHWTPNVQKWYLYIRKLNLKTLQIKENKIRKRLKRWKCNKTWASTNCRKSVKF